MIDIFIGITQGMSHNCISIGIVDFCNHTLLSKSFSLDNISFSQTMLMLKENIYSSDLNEIGIFLSKNIPVISKVQVVMEIPSVLIGINSIFFRLLLFLANKKYIEGIEFNIFYENKKINSLVQLTTFSNEFFDDQIVQLRFKYLIEQNFKNQPLLQPINSKSSIKPIYERGIIYIQPNISQAYAKFLLSNEISYECAAIVAALIGSHRSLYHFFISHGLVQSSQDIVDFIRNINRYPIVKYTAAVVSGSDVYSMDSNPVIKLDDITKIPLRYAVEKKRHEYLGENDALKFAFLYTCKHWNIKLTCSPLEDEYVSYPPTLCQERKYLYWKEHVFTKEESEGENIIYEPQETLKIWIYEGLKRSNQQNNQQNLNELGKKHPSVVQSYNNLALLYKNQGRYSEAEPLYKKALELRQRLLGEEHPDVAQSYNNLAALYNDQGRYREAEPLYKKALEIAELSLGVGHSNTILVRKNYADFLHNYANFLRNKHDS